MKYCKCKKPMKLIRSCNGDYLTCSDYCGLGNVYMPVPQSYYDDDIDLVADRGRD